MRYRFHHIDQAPRAGVEEFVRSQASLLESRLATFADDLIALDVRLDHHPKRYGERRNQSTFSGHLVLDLPGRKLPNLSAHGAGESWQTALNNAFGALESQLERTLAGLKRETAIHAYHHRPSWKRPGAEQLGKPQTPSKDDERWMETWDETQRA